VPHIVSNPNAPTLQLFSVVIPARDEEHSLPSTVEQLHLEFSLNNVPHEIIVVDDGSQDKTWEVLQRLKEKIPTLNPIQNPGDHGFGRAIVHGLRHCGGDAVVIMMADKSDDARDAVRYWKLLNEGWDCVFGSRFIKGGGVVDYPRVKLVMNRLVNFFIRVVFGIALNDTTNAFKAYRRTVIPIIRELAWLAARNQPKDVILIDDARSFGWESGDPRKKVIREYAAEHWPNHSFGIESDVICILPA